MCDSHRFNINRLSLWNVWKFSLFLLNIWIIYQANVNFLAQVIQTPSVNSNVWHVEWCYILIAHEFLYVVKSNVIRARKRLSIQNANISSPYIIPHTALCSNYIIYNNIPHEPQFSVGHELPEHCIISKLTANVLQVVECSQCATENVNELLNRY